MRHYATVVNESLFDYDAAIGGRIHIAVRADPLAEKSFIRLRVWKDVLHLPGQRVFDVHDRLVNRRRGVKLNFDVYAFRACTIGSKWCKLG